MSITLGVLIISISILGYFSNQLNGRYLNSRLLIPLYYIGALVHETSHALACLATGARIIEFKIFTRRPHVTHNKSKIPYLGQVIISLAPIIGGLFFLYLTNKFLLNDYFVITLIDNYNNLGLLIDSLITQLNLLDWQTWILVLLSLNIGAMIGPSARDLKNIWPAVMLAFFITWQPLTAIALLTLGLIIINIIFQIIIIFIKSIFRFNK